MDRYVKQCRTISRLAMALFSPSERSENWRGTQTVPFQMPIEIYVNTSNRQSFALRAAVFLGEAVVWSFRARPL